MQLNDVLKSEIIGNIEEEKEINRLFGWLNLIDKSDWLPPAIYFLVKYPDKASQIKDFFINLERLAAGLMILRADINERGKRYARVLDAIDEGVEKAIARTEELLSSFLGRSLFDVKIVT